MPVFITVTRQNGSQIKINANKILDFYRNPGDNVTYIDYDPNGAYVLETPNEIEARIYLEYRIIGAQWRDNHE